MKPSPDWSGHRRGKTFRDWLALLPWDFIYALGVVMLVALITLLVWMIGLLSR